MKRKAEKRVCEVGRERGRWGLVMVMILAAVVLLSGCGKTSGLKNYKSGDVAVIETKDNAEKTTVRYYDKELKAAGRDEMRFANTAGGFAAPFYYNETVYVIPQGLGKKKDEKKVLGINTKTGAVAVYDFEGINLLACAADEKYVYAAGNLNFESYIERVARDTKQITRKSLPKVYIPYLFTAAGDVWAVEVTMREGGDVYSLARYDTELNEKGRIDLTNIGQVGFDALEENGWLYLPVPRTADDKPIGRILAVETETMKTAVGQLPEVQPAALRGAESGILVSYFDPVIQEGTKVSLVDWNTLAAVATYDLGEKVMRMEVKDSKLYVLSPDGLHSYLLMLPEKIEKLQSVQFENVDGYISNLFLDR